MIITEKRLKEMQARGEAASIGPWEREPRWARVWATNWKPGWKSTGMIAECHQRAEDAIFIAAARSDMPALIAEVRRLREELEAIEDEIGKAEYMRMIESAEFMADSKEGR